MFLSPAPESGSHLVFVRPRIDVGSLLKRWWDVLKFPVWGSFPKVKVEWGACGNVILTEKPMADVRPEMVHRVMGGFGGKATHNKRQGSCTELWVALEGKPLITNGRDRAPSYGWLWGESHS